MKNLKYKIIAFLLIVSFFFNFFSATAFALSSDRLNGKISNKDYFKELVIRNEYLNTRIKQLQENNFNIDQNIKTLNGVDFIYYSNSDNSTVGLIQVHKDLNSEIRVNSIDSEPNTIEFIKEDGNKMILGKDRNGKFNRVIYKSEEDIVFRSAWWCTYVVGLVGTSISALYTKIAGMIGGPIAAIIVAGVSSIGWSYVSSRCK